MNNTLEDLQILENLGVHDSLSCAPKIVLVRWFSPKPS